MNHPASKQTAPEARYRLAWGAVLFGVWFAITSVFGAWTVAQHVIALPSATPQPQDTTPRFTAWYVLGSDCGCSASVADDLVKRRPLPDWTEIVWLVGLEPDLARRLTQVGYEVRHIDPAELARQHRIQGAPWLALFDRNGHPVYSGGYSRQRPGVPGAFNLTDNIMAAVSSGKPFPTLPAYGCATSEALRERLDPLHLKYPAASSP